MNIFLKATGGVLIGLLMHLILSKQGKDFSILVTVSICVMLSIIAAEFIEPIINFIHELRVLGSLDQELLGTLLKAVGIGVISEITGAVCTDAGNAALGKTLQLFAAIVILWLSIPLLTSLIDLVENLLVSI